MEWRDQGILLSVRRHGENAAIIEVLTRDHGRHAGVVRGGTSRKIAPILQPGAQLDVLWRARLEDHLGTYAVEPLRSRSADALGDRLALAGLNAVTALLMFSLAEREPHLELYERTEWLLDMLDQVEVWPLAYLHWELALLEDLGYGLDLTQCAVTGSTQDLIYVSPKTGRAVSRNGAGEWADRLLPLPKCLQGVGSGNLDDLEDGFRTTGHFLESALAKDLGNKPVPEARARFVDAFLKRQA